MQSISSCCTLDKEVQCYLNRVSRVGSSQYTTYKQNYFMFNPSKG